MSRLFAAMPRYLVLAALALSLAGVATADPIFFAVNPQASFLHASLLDTPQAPMFINLATYGALPGDTIILQTVGGLCYGTACQITDLIAAFTANDGYLGQEQLDRLNEAGLPVGITSIVTGTTWPLPGDPTDVPWDFSVPNASTLSVVIPTGATHLAVGVYDSWFTDNSAWTGDTLGINMEVLPDVPEPGTVVLLFSGLGLMAAFWRKRKA